MNKGKNMEKIKYVLCKAVHVCLLYILLHN
jgi:hypothetical protein